jgi:hypothetical protein
MPEQKTIKRARKAKRAGKSASTQAGEFVREEIDNIRAGKHGAKSAKQAIAIGLSKARRAGVDLKPPKKGEASEKTRKSAKAAYKAGQKNPRKKPSKKRSQATVGALQREGTEAASSTALARQAKSAAKKRPASERSAAAKKAVRTKGSAGRKRAAKKAARTRAKTAN